MNLKSSRAAIAAYAVAFTFALSCEPLQAQDARKSGFDFMSSATQTLQKDDTQNPAMLWANDGRAAWSQPAGAAKKSCANCHGDINRMRGVAARYPQYSTVAKRVVNLGQQINQCRVSQQQATAWPAENATLLGLETAIAMESRYTGYCN